MLPNEQKFVAGFMVGFLAVCVLAVVTAAILGNARKEEAHRWVQEHGCVVVAYDRGQRIYACAAHEGVVSWGDIVTGRVR